MTGESFKKGRNLPNALGRNRCTCTVNVWVTPVSSLGDTVILRGRNAGSIPASSIYHEPALHEGGVSWLINCRDTQACGGRPDNVGHYPQD